VLLLVVLVGYAAGRAVTGPQRPQLPHGGRWQPRHYGVQGQTVVAVSLVRPDGEVLDEHVVARFPDQDPDWSRLFLAARQEAEERAFHLNAE
jgi:pyridoxamine 5'-phosphate oxidase family protein